MPEPTAIIPKDFTEVREMSRQLSASALLPQALRKKPEDVLAIVLTGAELGLGPMQSLRLIHIIEGRPSMSADLIAGLCLQKPAVCEYVTLVESTAARATYETKRIGQKSVKMTWTIEQAKAAGLTGRPNWRSYPEAMLRARCVASLCRAVYPDLVGGLHTPGELEDGASDFIDGQIVAETTAPPPPPHPVGTQVTTSAESWAQSGPTFQSTQPEPPPQDEPPPDLFDAPESPPPPQPAPPSEPQKSALEVQIAACQSADDLKKFIAAIKFLPTEEKARVGRIYNARQAELRARR